MFVEYYELPNNMIDVFINGVFYELMTQSRFDNFRWHALTGYQEWWDYVFKNQTKIAEIRFISKVDEPILWKSQ